jgi:23S rRNA (cytosine1962-C5)-methyltransferase
LKRIVLKAGKEKSLKRFHPWIFSGAVARLEGQPALGEAVRVVASDGSFLAQAAFSPHSQIRARVWSWDEAAVIDAAFVGRAVQVAAQRRGSATVTRLIHGEADGLPGVVADRYEEAVVVQLLSAGAELWREAIADALAAQPGVTNVYERSDADVRTLEGLPPRTGALRGAVPPGPPVGHVAIHEPASDTRYLVDVVGGHKTGFYLDQAANRALAGQAARGADVLNCFCYTGGFSIAALKGGARSVLSIDSSGPALELARANMALNGLEAGPVGGIQGQQAEWLEADVFKALRELKAQGRTFDMVILDPPKFAPTPATVERAARAYKDINLLGLKLLRPGGKLFTFSCSGGVSADLFQKIVAGAAVDAGVAARIVARMAASLDHPVLLSFPEGEYLKGLVLQRD